MRYLGIDLGDKRTGLAVGDDGTRITTAIAVLETTDEGQRLRQIGDMIDEHGAAALVVGLPLNMDGSEGPRAKAARGFAGQLRLRFGLEVYMVDERLSSFAADQQLTGSGLTHRGKKQRRDALAASIILKSFLDSRCDESD